MCVWGGHFSPPPSQSNLNNFQLHILTLHPSLMSYLCDYVSVLAKKKKKRRGGEKKNTSNMHRLSTTRGHFLFSPPSSFLPTRTVGTVFNFEEEEEEEGMAAVAAAKEEEGGGMGDQSHLPHASLQVNTKRTT